MEKVYKGKEDEEFSMREGDPRNFGKEDEKETRGLKKKILYIISAYFWAVVILLMVYAIIHLLK